MSATQDAKALAAVLGVSVEHARRHFVAPVADLPRKSFVYFIVGLESGNVKIGKANDPIRRCAELQTGSPEPLVVAAHIPGGFEVEAELHLEFAQDRITGEWFRPTKELIAAIEAAGGTYPRKAGRPSWRVDQQLRITGMAKDFEHANVDLVDLLDKLNAIGHATREVEYGRALPGWLAMDLEVLAAMAIGWANTVCGEGQ